MFKRTRTARAVRTKWRVTSYILFRHIVICASQEADEVKCQYTQLKLSTQSNHPNPFIAAHGATGIRVEGDSGNDTLFGKSMEKPNSKSQKQCLTCLSDFLRRHNVVEFGKRDSNMFKLLSSCFMLQVSSYPSMPSPAPVLTLQVAPEKQLKHVGSTPTKSTFQDTFQVWSVINIFLPFTVKALSIMIQNCVDWWVLPQVQTIQNLHLLHLSSSFLNCNQNTSMTKSWTKSISPSHCQCSHWHDWNWSGVWFWKWCLTS